MKTNISFIEFFSYKVPNLGKGISFYGIVINIGVYVIRLYQHFKLFTLDKISLEIYIMGHGHGLVCQWSAL